MAVLGHMLFGDGFHITGLLGRGREIAILGLLLLDDVFFHGGFISNFFVRKPLEIVMVFILLDGRLHFVGGLGYLLPLFKGCIRFF